VLAVVLYHLWPRRLTGGYVGVDVFFAISGFLIVGHLLREIDTTSTLKLVAFWARRARRLLPASLLVLLATGVAVILWVPQVLWQQFTQEIGASALYVQNWLLAFNAVDYLGAENAASPVQHFWSLSVEEQFYIVWPLIILLVIALARRRRNPNVRRGIAIALIVVTVASFAYCVIETAVSAPAAYFVTTTRAWEFGAGGILAFFAADPLKGTAALRAAASWAGIIMIGIAVVGFTAKTPFPGYPALLPVVGTLLVIWAGSPDAWWSPIQIGRLRPVQWIGDISYSLYLWHWPILIIAPLALGHGLGFRYRVALLVFAGLLAWATKILVEDPFRKAAWLSSRRPWVTVAATVAATSLLVSGCGVVTVHTERSVAHAAAEAHKLVAGDAPCIGAAAATPGSHCAHPYRVSVLTNPTFAETDIGKGVQEKDQCKQTLADATVMTCDIGDVTSPTVTLALLGDSHAGHFLEPLDLYGREHHVKFVTYLKTWCAGTGASGVAAPGYATPENVGGCAAWGANALQRVAKDPRIDGVVFSNFTERYADPHIKAPFRAITPADFTNAWQPLLDAGKKVIVMRDIPNANGADVPRCIAQHLKEYDPCTTPRITSQLAKVNDPMMAAERLMPEVSVVDLTNIFCDGGPCHTLIGGVIVYFGSQHMTATFARTIAPFVGKSIELALHEQRKPPVRSN